MNRAMIMSAVTMSQIQKSIDLIANNLSNISTNGYKSRNATFSSLLFQNMTNQPDKDQNLGRLTPLGIRVGSGARVSDTQMDMRLGNIKTTDRPLDLALTEPDRFFSIQVMGPDGNSETRYTRDGNFYLNPDAANPDMLNLVTANGYFVLDEKGQRIQIPAGFSDIRFTPTGEVTYTMSGGEDRPSVVAGRLGIVSIRRPQLLLAQGDNTLALPNLASLGLTQADVLAANGDANVVQQGALESSNVDLTDQLTELMNMQRAYQFNARSLSISDQMQGLINDLRT